MNNADVAHRRSGYTLIEILVASVLVATLMIAAWGILSMYNTFISDGRTKTAEQQLVRSLFDVMRDDFADLSLPAPAETPLSESTTDRFSTGLSASELPPPLTDLSGGVAQTGISDSTAADLVSVQVQITGSETELRMTLRQTVVSESPTAESDIDLLFELGGGQNPEFAADAEAQSIVEEFTTVIYQFQPPFTSDGTGSTLPPGLYRIEVDPLALAFQEQSRTSIQETMVEPSMALDRIDLQSLMARPTEEATKLEAIPGQSSALQLEPRLEHIPEVVACQFEYLSDSSWGSEWQDGRATTRPAAIRVSLSILSTEELAVVGLNNKPVRTVTELPDELEAEPARDVSPTPELAGEEAADPFHTITPRHYRQIILLRNDPVDLESSPDPLSGGDFSQVLP